MEAKWIWGDNQEKDTYLSFLDSFFYCGQKTYLKVCAETEFVAYINGKRVLFGQFAGYEDVKYLESIEISKYCKKNTSNRLEIVVHYEGLNSFTHIDSGAGLFYIVENENRVLTASNENTLCGKDGDYIQCQKKFLTIQLGYSSTMQYGETEYKQSKVIDKKVNLLPRPIKRIELLKKVKAKFLKNGIFDLGKEETGYVYFKFIAKEDCTITVSYGEHLKFGVVERFLPGGYLNVGRDFSLIFNCKKGLNCFEQFFVRVACRYFHIDNLDKITVKEISIIPTRYPVKVKSSHFLKGIDRKIYNTCLRTLRLCMQNHYEDCPWREQSLYVLDSRNQMLCGYYAFDEIKYQREMLVFISKSKKIDNLLEITYPAKGTPAIPFFSLMYVVAVGEYIDFTNDLSILNEVEDTVFDILEEFSKRIDNTGLIPAFDKPFWNFYEWSKGSGYEEELDDKTVRVFRHDLIVNCAYIYAIKKYCSFDKKCKKFQSDVKPLLQKIKENFYNSETKLFFLSDVNKESYSQFSNALCCLIGLGNAKIIQSLKNNSLIPATLSMAGFVYDVLLKTNDIDDEKFILNDIRTKYSYMLSRGATTFWETLDGVNEKDRACSLCHGWSAMPVYYYNILRNKGDIL